MSEINTNDKVKSLSELQNEIELLKIELEKRKKAGRPLGRIHIGDKFDLYVLDLTDDEIVKSDNWKFVKRFARINDIAKYLGLKNTTCRSIYAGTFKDLCKFLKIKLIEK